MLTNNCPISLYFISSALFTQPGTDLESNWPQVYYGDYAGGTASDRKGHIVLGPATVATAQAKLLLIVCCLFPV